MKESTFEHARRIMTRFAISLLARYAVMLFLFTGLIIAVQLIPQSAICGNIVASAKTIEQEGIKKQFFNFKLFQLDNFTDSYMLNIAASADNSRPCESAMMNYNYSSKDYFKMAADTEKVAEGNIDGLEKQSYSRYWHGYLVFLRPLLLLFDYGQIRIINYILFALLIGACCVLLYRKVSKAVCWMFLASLVIINFYVVPYTMQFSTCFYIALISMFLLMKFERLSNNALTTLMTFFTIGGVTSYLDFLTTPQLTLGLPMITLLLMKKQHNAVKWVICLSVVWTMGYAMVWASKWMVGYLLTGNNLLADAMQSLELRTGDSYKGMHMTFSNICSFIWTKLEQKNLIWSIYMLVLVFVLAIGIYIKALKCKAALKHYGWLLIVAMIVPVWFCFTRNHSIQHGWFTWRAGLLTLYSMLLFIWYTTDIRQLFNFKKTTK